MISTLLAVEERLNCPLACRQGRGQKREGEEGRRAEGRGEERRGGEEGRRAEGRGEEREDRRGEESGGEGSRVEGSCYASAWVWVCMVCS